MAEELRLRAVEHACAQKILLSAELCGLEVARTTTKRSIQSGSHNLGQPMEQHDVIILRRVQEAGKEVAATFRRPQTQ